MYARLTLSDLLSRCPSISLNPTPAATHLKEGGKERRGVKVNGRIKVNGRMKLYGRIKVNETGGYDG